MPHILRHGNRVQTAKGYARVGGRRFKTVITPVLSYSPRRREMGDLRCSQNRTRVPFNSGHCSSTESILDYHLEEGGKGGGTPLQPVARTQLVEARKRQQWSQQEVADRLGTTQHNVSRWERGETRPGAYFRAKLCALFGMSAEELDLLNSME